MDEDKGLTKKQRNRKRRNKRYYKANKKRLTPTLLAYTRAHSKQFYEDRRAYTIARIRLRALCRPDLAIKIRLHVRYPYAPVEHVKFDPVTIAKLEIVYKRKLRELRKLFNRDPNTGRKLPSHEKGQP